MVEGLVVDGWAVQGEELNQGNDTKTKPPTNSPPTDGGIPPTLQVTCPTSQLASQPSTQPPTDSTTALDRRVNFQPSTQPPTDSTTALDRRVNSALLTYVLKSSQHQLLEAEYTAKLKSASKNVILALCLMAAFFG